MLGIQSVSFTNFSLRFLFHKRTVGLGLFS